MNISRFVSWGLIVKPFTIGKLQNNGLRTCCNPKILNYLDNCYSNKPLVNFVSTYEVKNVTKNESFIEKFLKKIPFLNVHQVKIKARGYMLYEGIADRVDYFEFFKEFDLPDTFYSWFTVTELHIWMLSVRAMADGDDGKTLRNSAIEAFWIDVSQRVKTLGSGSLRTQILELSEQMQASFIAYDEGIQSDDVVLAGAVWRRFYKMEHVDPYNLEKFVRHIRKQVCILDKLSSDFLFNDNPIQWLPFNDS